MKKFDNFISHLSVLERAGQEDLGNEFIISGIIDKFFVQFELGWKTLKEYLMYEGRGVASIGFPEDEVRLAGVVRREREVRGNPYEYKIYYTAGLRR